jgi:hypothetical protein
MNHRVGTGAKVVDMPRKRKRGETYLETLERLSSEQLAWLLIFLVILGIYLGLSALFEKVLHLPEMWNFSLDLVFFPMELGWIGTMGLVAVLRGEFLGKYGIVSRGVWAVILGLMTMLLGYGSALWFLVEGIKRILNGNPNWP